MKKVKLFLCVTNYALSLEGVCGSGGIDPRFLNLGTSWWPVSFKPRPIYPRRKSPRYPLDRRLGGSQNLSGRRGEEKILGPTGTRTLSSSVVQPVASRHTDCAIIILPFFSAYTVYWSCIFLWSHLTLNMLLLHVTLLRLLTLINLGASEESLQPSVKIDIFQNIL
jgi:hypothetical protein